MHETSVRWFLQRRRSRGDAFSAEAAPAPGSNKYQVYFKAPAGEGEPWKRVLRRAASEEEARKIFAQAEPALDTDKETPSGADVRASRTIRMLGEEYLRDSRERGKQPRTMEGCESRLNAHILSTIGDVPVTKWRVEHSRKVMEKGAKTLLLPAWPRGPARPAVRDAQAGVALGLARPLGRPARRPGDRSGERPAWRGSAVRGPAPASGDPSCPSDGRRSRSPVWPRREPTRS
jgi:hypothetical protein